MSTELRVAICATHPIQYQVPVWRHMASSPGVSLQAFFGTNMGARGYSDREFGTRVEWDTPIMSGYTAHFLSTNSQLERVGFWQPSALGLAKRFRTFRPHVVLLTAYAGRFHLESLWAARRAGARVLIRHEASDVAVDRSRIKTRIRDQILRQFYRQFDGFGVIGREARRHLLRLGVDEARMVGAPYCVDSDFFAGEVTRWGAKRERLRAEFGVEPNDVILVFSGKLIPKKDPLLIPKALALLEPALRARIHLVVAGSGELQAAMQVAVNEVIGRRGHFVGFLNQSQIGRVYAAGDLLMLPSRKGAGETWGLVVNEAMQFGLGVLVSDGVGCAPDLITSSTGLLFASGNPADAAVAVRVGVESIIAKRDHFSTHARRRVEDYSSARAAAGILRLARAVMQPG